MGDRVRLAGPVTAARIETRRRRICLQGKLGAFQYFVVRGESGRSGENASGLLRILLGSVQPESSHRQGHGAELGDTRYVRVQYDIIVEFQGQPIRHRNVHYYFVFQQKWVDVHISVTAPTKADEDIFAAFDRSLHYGA